MSTPSLHDARALAHDIITRFDGGAINGMTTHSDDGHSINRDVVIDGHTYSLWVTVRGKSTTVSLYTSMAAGFSTVMDLRSESMSPDTVEKIIRTAATDHQEQAHAHQ